MVKGKEKQEKEAFFLFSLLLFEEVCTVSLQCLTRIMNEERELPFFGIFSAVLCIFGFELNRKRERSFDNVVVLIA